MSATRERQRRLPGFDGRSAKRAIHAGRPILCADCAGPIAVWFARRQRLAGALPYRCARCTLRAREEP